MFLPPFVFLPPGEWSRHGSNDWLVYLACCIVLGYILGMWLMAPGR
jgi:hypothetical protein